MPLLLYHISFPLNVTMIDTSMLKSSSFLLYSLWEVYTRCYRKDQCHETAYHIINMDYL